MSIWQKLLYLLGLRPNPNPRTYQISESLQSSLTTLAQHEGRGEQELIPDILAVGLTQYRSAEDLWPKWESLSLRERDITALTCLGLTNRQIAARLSLSPETVKTHIRNACLKFSVSTKAQLRQILANWDFSGWQ